MSFRNNPRLYIISWFVAIGGLLCGYQTGVMSGIHTNSSFSSTFNTSQYVPEGRTMYTIYDFLVGVLLLGCSFGALIAGRISDHLSRKYSIIVSSIVFITGAALQTASCGLPMLTIGRFISGE